MADRAEAAAAARALLRAAAEGCLATVAEGVPHAALVSVATTGGLDVLLLLSELSAHTRQLNASPVCSLLCVDRSGGADINPQLRPRLSLVCDAARSAEAGLKARFVALHPYAGAYAGFGDFAIWRLRIRSALLVEGFGRAFRPGADQMRPDAALADAIGQRGAAAIEGCNARAAPALRRIAQAWGGREGDWRLAAIDEAGCDLVCEQGRLRVAWLRPLDAGCDVGGAVAALAEAAPDAAGGVCQPGMSKLPDGA